MAERRLNGPNRPGEPEIDRRLFIAAGLGGAAAWLTGCASGSSGPGTADAGGGPATSLDATAAAGGAPDAATMTRWIEEIVARGVRRPGYDADVWVEQFIVDHLTDLGLDVHLEPVEVTRWEPLEWSLHATPADGRRRAIDCFPLPYSAPVTDLRVELAGFDTHDSGTVAGRAALVDAPVVRVAPDAVARAGSAPADLDGRIYDPDGTFAGSEHILPHTAGRNRVADPAIAAGAAAFIGTLVDYPGDGHQYFVPYHGQALPIPGVWISGTDGQWLHDALASGPVVIELDVTSTSTSFESHNVIGELPGPDDEIVLVGSHHDGPWASAVEDGTGIAMVLAQAAHWAAQPQVVRPHRLRFVLQAGHMSGGAGAEAYVAAHAAELASIVLEVHLEHAALDDSDASGTVTPTGQCVPRWFFTSRIPALERTVSQAISAEDLRRSMLVAPDALGANPPTDGSAYYAAGVPIVHLLSAPWYLFDQADRPDKVDRDHLEPITRAVVRIIESTAGVTAAAIRDAAAG